MPLCRIILAALLLLAGRCAGALGAGGTIAEVRIGLGGQFKLGCWTPVWVTLQAGDEALQGDLTVAAPDGEDIWAAYSGGSLRGIAVPARQSRTVAAYVRIGRQYGKLLVEVNSGSGKLSRLAAYGNRPPAVLASQQRVVVIGSALGMEQAAKFLPRPSGEAIVMTELTDASALPEHWYGYDGVDALVLTADRLEFYDALTPAQQQALELWMRLGGRVMISAGRQGQAALASGSLLAELAPGRFARTAPLRNTASLEAMAEGARLDAAGGPDSPAVLSFTQLSETRGQVLLAGANGEPLVIRAPHGLGAVLFVGLDLDQPPIAQWAGRGRLVARLLEALWSETAPADEQRASGKLTHLGFSDLSGQLRAALDQFPGVHLAAFSWVAAVIVAYIVMIGPVDYFVLRRLGRMELTWVTFPLTAIAVGTAAWLLAVWARGEGVHTNQVDVVDVDSATGTVRGTSWLQIYSPRSQRFDLSLSPALPPQFLAQPAEVLLAWQGQPGRGLMGMDSPSRLSAGEQGYAIENARPAGQPANLKLQALPLGDGMTRSLLGRWQGELRGAVDADLQATANNLLRGRVQNPLPLRLSECVLYFDRWAWPLGTLAPGEEVAVESLAQPLDVKYMLTERRFVDSRDVSAPWDQAMRDDVPRIVRVMMFHEAAGGRSFTRLAHRQCGFIDLSSQLMQRAMLVGQAEEPAASLARRGLRLASSADRHWTFYRVVLPVRAQ